MLMRVTATTIQVMIAFINSLIYNMHIASPLAPCQAEFCKDESGQNCLNYLKGLPYIKYVATHVPESSNSTFEKAVQYSPLCS